MAGSRSSIVAPQSRGWRSRDCCGEVVAECEWKASDVEVPVTGCVCTWWRRAGRVAGGGNNAKPSTIAHAPNCQGTLCRKQGRYMRGQRGTFAKQPIDTVIHSCHFADKESNQDLTLITINQQANISSPYMIANNRCRCNSVRLRHTRATAEATSRTATAQSETILHVCTTNYATNATQPHRQMQHEQTQRPELQSGAGTHDCNRNSNTRIKHQASLTRATCASDC